MSAETPDDPKPVVVIHTGEAQMVAARVAAHALKSRSKTPDLFDVRFLRLEDTPQLYKRNNQRFTWWDGEGPTIYSRHDLQAFAALRRMVPQLLGFRGRALVIDPDVFAIGDVYELLSRDMKGKAILCYHKPQLRNGVQLYSSAVMLLDCSKLTHWQWDRDMDDIFRGAVKFGPWLSLLDEPPEHIGLFEPEWNHFDTLTDKTKLLHLSELTTQPWKTGLPADYREHAPRWPAPIEKLRRIARRIASGGKDQTFYTRPHPDPRQEQFFFTLLRECVEEGVITREFLRHAMRKNYLRKDAFKLLDRPR